MAIINSGSSAVKMLKAEAEAIKGDSEHLRVDFLHPTIQPGKEVPNALRVSFVPRVGSETKLEGKIIVHTNDTNPINTMFEIWYVARILSGRIRYNPERTHFVVEPPSAECAWLASTSAHCIAGTPRTAPVGKAVALAIGADEELASVGVPTAMGALTKRSSRPSSQAPLAQA